jgi:hypothetical protein
MTTNYLEIENDFIAEASHPGEYLAREIETR